MCFAKIYVYRILHKYTSVTLDARIETIKDLTEIAADINDTGV